jgi:hypothetical protein
MADEQPKLLNGPDKKSLGGPVFDFGPGWGFYVKRWLGKYLFKIILPAVVVIVAMGIYASRNEAENNAKVAANKKITVIVAHGDSRALLARKALAEYSKENPQEILTGGQKLFIEEILRRKLNNPKLTIGEEIEFYLGDIEAAVYQSKNLSSYQLEVWENYARGIKF